MVNVEIDGNRSSFHEVQSNYSHFNLYKDPDMVDLNAGIVSYEINSSAWRQIRVDEFSAPQSADDIRHILSDTKYADNPVYNGDATVATLLLHGNGSLHIWANVSSNSGPPQLEWDLSSLFDVPVAY